MTSVVRAVGLTGACAGAYFLGRGLRRDSEWQTVGGGWALIFCGSLVGLTL